MSNLAGKVDVKNMMKGDDKDTTGKKDSKKDKALAKGLKDSTVENEKSDKLSKANAKGANDRGDQDNVNVSATKPSVKFVRKDVDLNNVQKMDELLEEYNFLGGDQLSEFDVMFIKK
jgi:hypothetical protein